MIHADTRKAARRSAFTLTEVLVVLVIVSIIISLSAAAAIQILAYVRASNTQSAIQTLDTVLKRQWSAVVRKAKAETPPGAILAMANGNTGIAQIIWIKLRLKQQFPMNFSEAIYPWALPPGIPSGSDPIHQAPVPPGNNADPGFGPNVLPGDPAYLQALRGAGIYIPAALETPGGTNLYPAAVTPRDWPSESGVLLLLALQQNRDGSVNTGDEISKLGQGPYLDPATGQDTGLKMLVDGWGVPLTLYRWPTPFPVPYDPLDPNNTNNRDVDNSSPMGPFAPGVAGFRDADDPEGKLQDKYWNTVQNWSAQSGVFWYELHCHSVHEVSYFARSYYMPPLIVSAGRNHLSGYAQPPSPVFSSQGNPLFSPFLPDPMCIDAYPDLGNAGYHDASNDNILSYRMRQGAKPE